MHGYGLHWIHDSDYYQEGEKCDKREVHSDSIESKCFISL